MASPALDVERIRRGGLYEFVKRAFHIIESVKFIDEPHMKLICDHFQASALHAAQSLDYERQPWMDGLETIPELVIACPPGVSKSLITMVLGPAWLWTWAPQMKLITTSYSDGLATRDAKRAFELMTSEWYLERWPKLSIDGGERASMSYYVNSVKGSRYSVQMGGQVTGRHAHMLLGDDPIKPQDLALGGESTRDALTKVIDRWDNVFSSRTADPSTFARVIIAQRLHENDLSGHCIKQGALHLCLPMEFDPKRAYASRWGEDWRTEPGQLLAPIRFPADVIDKRKAIMSSKEYASQMQQLPSPEDGSTFGRYWFEYRYTGRPWWGKTPMVMSVDASMKEGASTDYTVIQVWCKTSASEYYLVDQIRARMGFSDQLIAIKSLKMKWHNIRNILVETKANGEAILQTLQRQIPGVIGIDPRGGKQARAEATTWLWRAGNIKLPHKEQAPWIDDFIEEHVVFPSGSHDDTVDAASQALTWLSARDRKSLFEAAMANALKRFQ